MKKIVSKKHRSVVWELSDRGFGSELNNLIYAINFCSKKNLKLNVITNKWNISRKNGWYDYFLKTSRFNIISYKSIITYGLIRFFFSLNQIRQFQENNKKVHFIKRIIIKGGLALLKFQKQKEVFLYECFNTIRQFNRAEQESDRKIFVKKMNIILKDVLRYNKKTALKISMNKSLFSLSNYAVFHIRRGDKITSGEDVLSSYESYIKKLQRTKINSIFIMTDDYSVFEEMVKKYPMYKFQTLTKKTQRGHFQSSFNKMSINEIESNTINLLTEIEIARESELFVGSLNSNIYRLIEYIKIDKCVDISNFPSKYDF